MFQLNIFGVNEEHLYLALSRCEGVGFCLILITRVFSLYFHHFRLLLFILELVAYAVDPRLWLLNIQKPEVSKNFKKTIKT